MDQAQEGLSEPTLQTSFDVVIAGGGLAGMLAATRVLERRPNVRILIIEKEDTVGGRLRCGGSKSSQWGYGLGRISGELYDFWNQSIKTDPEAKDLPAFASHDVETVGFLFGAHLNSVPANQFMDIKGARGIGGLAAGKQWISINELLTDETAAENEREGKAFGAVWSESKKGPAGSVLEQFAPALGINDVWTAATGALVTRARMTKKRQIDGAWDDVFASMIQSERFAGQVTVKTNCRIVHADLESNQWSIDTDRGEFFGTQLVIAQSPWQAIQWLPKKLWPSSLLTIATKTKPVSIVVLSEKIIQGVELPDMVLVPSENVQVMTHLTGEINYHAVLDFEVSMQAPEVVKAVKRLKRASRKLHQAKPELKTEGEHIALIPVGWAQSVTATERRWLDKLEGKDFNSGLLAFCGDAYGASYHGDENTIKSVLSATEAMCQ